MLTQCRVPTVPNTATSTKIVCVIILFLFFLFASTTILGCSFFLILSTHSLTWDDIAYCMAGIAHQDTGFLWVMGRNEVGSAVNWFVACVLGHYVCFRACFKGPSATNTLSYLSLGSSAVLVSLTWCCFPCHKYCDARPLPALGSSPHKPLTDPGSSTIYPRSIHRALPRSVTATRQSYSPLFPFNGSIPLTRPERFRNIESRHPIPPLKQNAHVWIRATSRTANAVPSLVFASSMIQM